MNLSHWVVSLLTLTAVLDPGQRARETSSDGTGTGWVNVDVVEHSTSAPIPNAAIILTSLAGGARHFQSTTFSDGSVRFEDVPAGRYAVSAKAVEHLPAPGVHPTTWWPTATLIVQPNEASHITLTLAKAPAIQGLVVSPDGQPISGAIVSVLTTTRTLHTRALFKEFGNIGTDANGRFRIPSLVPGEYRLRVSLDRGTPPRFNDVYWPGATVLTESQPITLTYGDEVPVDIVAPAIPTVRVTGRILDLSGRPVSGADISFRADTLEEVSVRSQADGTFVVPRLRSAQYHVLARVRGATATGHVSHAAVSVLEVGVSDVRDVTLTVMPTSTVTGIALFNGEEGADPGRLAVLAAARGADGHYRDSLVTSGGWHADGRFELYGLLGPQVLLATGYGSQWRADAILLEDGTDLLTAPFDFSDGRSHRNVRVRLTDQVAAIRVTVTGDRPPGSTMTAFAFRDDGVGWDRRSGQVQSGIVSAAGVVTLGGLAPGKVYLVALFSPATPAPGVTVFPAIDESLLSSLAATAVRVLVPGPGELGTTTLKSESAYRMP